MIDLNERSVLAISNNIEKLRKFFNNNCKTFFFSKLDSISNDQKSSQNIFSKKFEKSLQIKKKELILQPLSTTNES